MWDVMLCHWVIGFQCLKAQVAFISKGQAVREDLSFPEEGTMIL
jgi:flagellar biosynthesis GTPase FlhF